MIVLWTLSGVTKRASISEPTASQKFIKVAKSCRWGVGRHHQREAKASLATMKATSTQLPICKVARPAGKKCDLDSIKLPRGRRPRGAEEEKVEVRLKGSHFWGSEGALRRNRTCQPSPHQGSLPNSQLRESGLHSGQSR